MKNVLIPFLVLITGFTQIFAQSPSAEPQLPTGTTIPAMLDKWVDARKNKVGDEVIAETTAHVKLNGQVVLPKGSKILGHVTEAKIRTNDDPNSVLGIFFDRAILKKGSELPLRLTIQAVAPDVSSNMSVPTLAAATTADSTAAMGPLNHPSTMGPNSDPNAGTPGRPESPENPAYDQTGGRTANGGLTPQCHGVLGIDGLALASRPNDSTRASLIVSRTKNVRLDGRTQLMLSITDK
jgi:hypothetical protein